MALINRIFDVGEYALGLAQGKGWGTATLEAEVRSAAKIFGTSGPGIVIDAGANHGLWTQAALRVWPDSEFHLFEPAKSNTEVLKEKFSSDTRVHLNTCGLASANKKGTLFADSPGSGLGSLSERRLDHFGMTFKHSESVELLTFDEYWEKSLGERPIGVFKMDIEGHELEALNGSIRALEKTQVIQFEFGGANIDTRTFFQDFWYFLTPKGFAFYRITPFGLNRIVSYSERDEVFRTTNYLAARI